MVLLLREELTNSIFMLLKLISHKITVNRILKKIYLWFFFFSFVMHGVKLIFVGSHIVVAICFAAKTFPNMRCKIIRGRFDLNKKWFNSGPLREIMICLKEVWCNLYYMRWSQFVSNVIVWCPSKIYRTSPIKSNLIRMSIYLKVEQFL